MKELRFIAMVSFVISIPFLSIALKLYNIFYHKAMDGDGIGLYFLGFEINDKLPYVQIPIYLWSSAAIGIILIIISFFLFLRTSSHKTC